MFTFIAEILKKEHITSVSMLPLSSCRITKPHLLQKTDIRDGTVVIFTIPYFSPACQDPARNVSAYAVPRDYHLFFSELCARLLPVLKKTYPDVTFAAFSDHSPIDERDAAAKAGLGVIGKNGLLLTPHYSSYVFLGEIIFNRVLPCMPLEEAVTCHACGRCASVCPGKQGPECLSALTQKKGVLTPDERRMLTEHETVWGCDLCQEVCPYTEAALKNGTIYTPIPFFKEACIPTLDSALLTAMSEESFSERAYSWRGRDTVSRNISLHETKERR